LWVGFWLGGGGGVGGGKCMSRVLNVRGMRRKAQGKKGGQRIGEKENGGNAWKAATHEGKRETGHWKACGKSLLSWPEKKKDSLVRHRPSASKKRTGKKGGTINGGGR